jgi:hypothetical protein
VINPIIKYRTKFFVFGDQYLEFFNYRELKAYNPKVAGLNPAPAAKL